MLNITDARTANNTLAVDTLAVPFLTYIDRTFISRAINESRKHA